MQSRPATPPRSRSGQTQRSPGTPRRRKAPASQRLRGIKPLPRHLSTHEKTSAQLVSKLQLDYIPDSWQVALVMRILQGYDSIFCAGTGYGKSLIFQGLAVLGGSKKLVVVISPLKALEYDQVLQATAKGIKALAINEDTTGAAGLWKDLRTDAQLAYISPEMARSDSFTKLWKDPKFRGRLTAMVTDEAHCVDEWGGDEFRPDYRKLDSLRNFTGQEVPFVACTATAATSTFEVIWDSLGFGHRPFWGIDAIDKCLFYFNSEAECRLAVRTLRKCLPAHLRDCVQPFSSNLSEEAKTRSWEGFSNGHIRILCATDAAGMGCNVPDVRYSVIFGCPKSLATVAQRWGRAGRDRLTKATCILLV
ncbi:hypothetical protein PLICRDRAFT_118086, partial [Plicaturopsis crispa FD-325 SS-3]